MEMTLFFNFSHNMLQLSSGIEAAGSINWKLALCLLLAWIMVYFCIWKGIRTTGKVRLAVLMFRYSVFMIHFCFTKGVRTRMF